MTHPDLTPNFEVGDTYQYVVFGAPNKPVYATNNATTPQYIGQTDARGHLVTTGVDIAAWIGSYTQIWSVGNQTASPALTFVVGQFGTSGTVTSTDVGTKPNGHLEGVSSLSITNGVLSTYSATVLDYTAGLYYDSETVATLFDDGAQVNQAVSQITTSTSINLSGSPTTWQDYDLQTDHYAIAYFASGGSYENPLYWGDSCYAETGDCSVDNSGGDYPYWVTAQAIYLGGTLADQTYVPQDGSLPGFDTSAYDGFAQSTTPVVSQWVKRLTALFPAIALLNGAFDPNKLGTNPPIPMMVDLTNDVSDLGTAQRLRTFTIKDTNGRPWNMKFPLRVRERFSDVYTGGGGTAPQPTGIWYNLLPVISDLDTEIDDNSQFTDHHQGNSINISAQIYYFQYYYATDFLVPSYLASLSSLMTVPGIVSPGPAVPLFIRDRKNKNSVFSYLPAERIALKGPYVYFEGDNGPRTNCRAQ